MLQEHLEETYRYLFDAAHRALRDGASFAPFGAAVRKTGEKILTAVSLSVDVSTPGDHISDLITFFRSDDADNGLIAIGLVFDGQMTQDGANHTRALCFHLEAANGNALEVMVPYARKFEAIIDFDEPQVSPVQPEVFFKVTGV
jgi:hypothetical protein